MWPVAKVMRERIWGSIAEDQSVKARGARPGSQVLHRQPIALTILF